MTNKLKEFITKNASLIDDPSINIEDLVTDLKYMGVMAELTKDEKVAFIIYYQVATGNPIFISLKKSKRMGGPYGIGELDYHISYKPYEWLLIHSIPLNSKEEKVLSYDQPNLFKKFAAKRLITNLEPEIDGLGEETLFNLMKLIGEN